MTLPFLQDLRQIIGEAESLGADMGRIAIVQEINLQSGKKISRADLEVAINQGAPTTIVQRKVDPNDTHPFSAGELVERLNEVRKNGKKLTMHDLKCMAWRYGLREDTKYAWQGTHNPSCVWSGDALSFLKNRTDEEFDRVREEHKLYLREKRHGMK